MNVICLTIWNPNAEATRSLHMTQAGAYEALVNFVEGNWDSDIIDQEVDAFECNDDMVDYFFEFLADDFQYDITSEPIQGQLVMSRTPRPDPDVVELNPVELKATIHAVECANLEEMADNMGTNTDDCYEITKVVLKKLKY